MNTEEKPSKEILEQWHNDPNNWLWGFFIIIKKINGYSLLKKLNFWVGQ